MGGPGSGPRKGQRRKTKPVVRPSKQLAATGFEELASIPRERIIVRADEIVVNSHDIKYSLETVQAIVDNIILRGLNLKRAAILAGIDEDTMYAWKNDRPDFRQIIERARTHLQAWLVATVDAQVEHNWAGGMTRLEREFPDEFGRRDRLEHVGNVQIGINVAPMLRDARWIELMSELEAISQNAPDVIEGEVVQQKLPPHEERK